MSTKNRILRMSLFVLLVGMVASSAAFAGSAVIGSVAGSMNATVGGQALLPNTTLFSGDSLQVKDGVAVVAIDKGSRMVFGRDTTASFLRDTNEVTVLLSQGSVSVFHPEGNVPVRVRAGNVSVVPEPGFKTLGDVAMLGNSVVITAKEGTLNVDGNGKTVKVAKGQTITIAPKTVKKGGGAAWGGGSNTALAAGALGAGVAAAILSGISMSRSGDAKDAANQASATATAAKASADAAAANAADAAAAAAAAQAAADNAAFLSGCTLNAEFIEQGQPSPYHGPGYQDCPPLPGQL
jgi:hypothetical protein